MSTALSTVESKEAVQARSEASHPPKCLELGLEFTTTDDLMFAGWDSRFGEALASCLTQCCVAHIPKQYQRVQLYMLVPCTMQSEGQCIAHERNDLRPLAEGAKHCMSWSVAPDVGGVYKELDHHVSQIMRMLPEPGICRILTPPTPERLAALWSFLQCEEGTRYDHWGYVRTQQPRFWHPERLLPKRDAGAPPLPIPPVPAAAADVDPEKIRWFEAQFIAQALHELNIPFPLSPRDATPDAINYWLKYDGSGYVIGDRPPESDETIRKYWEARGMPRPVLTL
jgi:hypothetical protein